MPTIQRYDFAKVQATKTPEGFIIDSPVIGRIGIQHYQNADGSVRKELRIPDEVFKADSLTTFKGKPITHQHRGMITAQNADGQVIGTMLSEGRRDGDYVRADIVIHQPDAMGASRELSIGYMLELDETPGEYNGEKYDSIQRNIRVNHLAVVDAARAGPVARLNVDGNEILTPETKEINMPKIRLDNNIEYDAAPEVIAAFDGMRTAAAAAALAMTGLTAERDTLKARVDGIATELANAKAAGRADALARLALESTAEKFKVDHKGKTDRQVKELVILTVRKDAALTDKSDVYIDAAYDASVEMAGDGAMAEQRKTINTPKTTEDGKPKKSAYDLHMENLSAGPGAKK